MTEQTQILPRRKEMSQVTTLPYSF